jgi:DNA polymerase-1
LIGKGAKATTFDTVPVDTACEYACEDADIAWRLAVHFTPLLQERGLASLMDDVEVPLIGVLARMEQAGIAIDKAVFARLQQDIEQRLRALETEIHELAGGPFQINSPKQLQEILFDRIGLKPVRKTKTGYSTDMEVLEQLASEHPLPERILAYRTLEKLRGTYVEALPKLVHPDTGRIHTSFNQTIAATGRLSSSQPNLQNIPIRTADGRRIRQGFVPGRNGDKLISADYSQIELRVLAHLSRDEAMLTAFRDDRDIHTETAARIFGVDAAAVDAGMRRQAKAVNFGVVYGQSAFGLARSLGISNADAARFITQYFEQFPGVKAWHDATLTQAREQGFVTTLLNRRRYLPELQAGDANTRKQGERVAINTPVQGSAADIIKVAMVRLDERLAGTNARMLVQVHDELLVEAPAAEAEEVAETIRETMQHAVELAVTLKVDAGIGNNWDEIH